MGATLMDYLAYRGNMLNTYAEPHLMDVDRAREVFEQVHSNWPTTRKIPMNKQKEEKANYAYFTAIINMLIEQHSAGLPCNFDPQQLISVVRDYAPLRTLSRRLDGAFPSVINPLAVWEVKEYYYTTTFGSRIADGVYETLLDGMEIEELQEHEGINIRHYLMIDSHTTWWKSGRSYLCRLVDMLHMGFVDEVLFGYEVVERLPGIVAKWVRSHNSNRASKSCADSHYRGTKTITELSTPTPQPSSTCPRVWRPNSTRDHPTSSAAHDAAIPQVGDAPARAATRRRRLRWRARSLYRGS